jgi:hypothetical protein
MAGDNVQEGEPPLVSAQEKNLNLQLKGPEFTYLTTVMTMYIDSAKGYVQVATGALLLPIVFLHSVMGLKQEDALTWIPGPMWLSWILLLLSIGAGLLYQVRAVRYLEIEMEGGDQHGPDSLGERVKQSFDKNPGDIFDVMVLAFYLGTTFFVIGAVEARHYYFWLPYVLCPAAVLLTGAAYKFVM